MLSTVLCFVMRSILWIIAAAIGAFVLLFVVVATSRYERTEGSCPDISLDTLRDKVQLRLKEHGIPPDSIRFDGAPQYHAWKLGVWEFPLRVDGTRYSAMIDCNEQLASFGEVKDQPVDQTGRARDRTRLRQ
ncbi:hypothetical protein DIE07_25910 [Burkholderia sp. Bp9002]|nr:hypothetical protein DIE07_25910 [Burkholderia sp. Bp9002]